MYPLHNDLHSVKSIVSPNKSAQAGTAFVFLPAGKLKSRSVYITKSVCIEVYSVLSVSIWAQLRLFFSPFFSSLPSLYISSTADDDFHHHGLLF